MSLVSDEKRHSPVTRLKLIVPTTDPAQRQTQSTSPQPQPSIDSKVSSSPARPSYSPVTPPADAALPTLSVAGQSQSKWTDEPTSLPVDTDENSDAMALRAAISILQLQRQQALKDMRSLELMKKAGLEDPNAFVQDLRDGKLTQNQRMDMDVDVDLESDDENDNYNSEDGKPHQNTIATKFGKLPTPQNIVRCPPIEWGKYHIVGDALDRLHEHQRNFPGPDLGDRRDQRSRPHEVAAPYRPFTDTLDASQRMGISRSKGK